MSNKKELISESDDSDIELIDETSSDPLPEKKIVEMSYDSDSDTSVDISDDNEDDDEYDVSEEAADNGSEYPLSSEWCLWYHHSRDNWKIDGYRKIYTIHNIKEYWDFHNNIDKIGGINSQHFFLMRDNIEPIWEHPKNKKGGCWSFKVSANKALDLWMKISMYMIGETLTAKPDLINGLSICLKNNQSVIKIWNSDSKENSIDLLPDDIKNEYGFNILYKANIPEY